MKRIEDRKKNSEALQKKFKKKLQMEKEIEFGREIGLVIPALGVGSSLILLLSLLKRRKNHTLPNYIKEEKTEGKRKIFFKANEYKNDEQIKNYEYFSSLESVEAPNPMGELLMNVLEVSKQETISDLLTRLFSPPLQIVSAPPNLIRIPAEKEGPFKCSHYPSNNTLISKAKGLCLLSYDLTLETSHLDNFYPEVRKEQKNIFIYTHAKKYLFWQKKV